MLGAETNDAGLIDEAIRYAESFYQDGRIHPSVAWMYIAKARFLQNHGDAPNDSLSRAKGSLPAEYVFEHSWLDHWLALVSNQEEQVSKRIIALSQFRPEAAPNGLLLGYGFDSELVDCDLPNAGIANINWAINIESLWAQRGFFLF